MRADHIFLRVWCGSCLFLFLLLLLAGCSREHPGERIYQKNCSQCHSTSGLGLKKLYPPMAGSLYLSARIDELACLIIRGSRATMKTADRRRGSFMPPIKTISTPDMLLLFDYLQQRWSDRPVPVSEPMLAKWLKSCAP